MLGFLIICAVMWFIASALYEPEKGNRTQVLMGIALFAVLSCAYTALKEDYQLDPAALLGKIINAVLPAYIATLVKDSKN